MSNATHETARTQLVQVEDCRVRVPAFRRRMGAELSLGTES
jgi:hypothetical protein